MPEKLQIVKPMEGSATLHHWQRLATPNMAGIFEEREGVQIKHERPLEDLESTVYSLLDPEEEGKSFHYLTKRRRWYCKCFFFSVATFIS